MKALNAIEMINAGLIPEEVLKAHNIELEKPAEKPVEVPVVEPTPVPEKPVVQPAPEVKVEPMAQKYTVKPGDVLWKIAKQFNTTWEKLAEYNKLKNPNLIFPNQVILIP